jgi:hypothetical protein
VVIEHDGHVSRPTPNSGKHRHRGR